MIFDYNIPLVAIALFGAALLALLYISFVYTYRMRVVRKHRQKCNDNTDVDEIVFDMPRVSVVVCASDDAETLERVLVPMLEQTYLGRFEVIVVNDGANADVSLAVTRLKNTYSNLYLTFTPDDSRNLSRKKLAITLGVKAAKSELIVITDGTTEVGSDKWLEKIVSPFTSARTDVVLGYNRPYLGEGKWRGRLVAAFDAFADDVAWLSTAINGKPYRGCGSNLAYRRGVFFGNKGFSRSLNIKHGDDDLFVNEITTRDNTSVEIADQIIGTSGSQYNIKKRMKDSRRAHAFTGRSLPKTARRMMAAGEWAMWIVLLCSLAAGYLSGLTNIFGWSVAAILILVMAIVVAAAWHKTIISLGGPAMRFTLPFIALMRPWRNLWISLSSGRTKNFSWQ